jgi:GT2 family glycosyltransferase
MNVHAPTTVLRGRAGGRRHQAESLTIAVALACFNRRETTLRCLASLFAQQTDQLRLSVHLLDDASTDGTADAVRARFPEVEIIAGSGRHYWGGGMHAAMHAALREPFDALLLLNDDVVLAPGGLQTLLDARAIADAASQVPNIIVGATADPATGAITYSGFRRTSALNPFKLRRCVPDGRRLAPCDTMNGNCVLVPVEVVTRIGTVDPVFIHQLGDIDYGYRARAAGARLWIAPAPVGTCAPGDRPRRWSQPGLSIHERWRLLNAPLGLPLRPWLTFGWRHAGPLGLGIVAAIYGKVILRDVFGLALGAQKNEVGSVASNRKPTP